MYPNPVHRVSDRIVSVSHSFVRPNVCEKAGVGGAWCKAGNLQEMENKSENGKGITPAPFGRAKSAEAVRMPVKTGGK